MRKFDLNPKVSDEQLNVRTPMGGLITILTAILIAILIYQAKLSSQIQTKQQAFFKPSFSSASPLLHLTLNITIAYPCLLLHISLTDSTGNKQNVVQLTRQSLNENFTPIGETVSDRSSAFSQCGNCYGSNYSKCCLTCFDVANSFRNEGKLVPNLNGIEQCNRDKKSIADKEMCRITGTIPTEFAKGELLITPGGSITSKIHFKHDLTYFGESVNLSHWISEFRFGPKVAEIKNPLDGAHWKQYKEGFSFQRYTISLIPTTVGGSSRGRICQYSAYFTEKEIQNSISKRMPGIGFVFETSPISLKIVSTGGGLLGTICAIIGGCFALAGLADSFWFKISPKSIKIF